MIEGILVKEGVARENAGQWRLERLSDNRLVLSQVDPPCNIRVYALSALDINDKRVRFCGYRVEDSCQAANGKYIEEFSLFIGPMLLPERIG